ncbi:MAG: NAD(P)/FAD-dependent oxidoreductase [Phycisphaerae bacterium]|nr:NAD(P)/FAD-dependent oxidoreductase [Phycisphaerae bacterium]
MIPPANVIIIGAGAAGLATAIFAARANSALRIVLLEGARKPGAKILVSGGGRCNVTNRVVGPGDFFGGSAKFIGRVLAEFPAERAAAFFSELGVPLHEEEHGKLFPDSNSARTVLAALLGEVERLGGQVLCERRVVDVQREPDGFVVATVDETFRTPCVVLGTGGLSLPRTGSDGWGLELARRLGHTIVPTTPALAPLILEGDFHGGLSGVSQEVEITAHIGERRPVRIRGAMLWTHFGVSGPAAMNVSRIWHRAVEESAAVRLTVNNLPDDTFESAERMLLATVRDQPRVHLRNALAPILPGRFVDSLLGQLGLDGTTPMAHLSREHRRRLVHGLVEWPMPMQGTRGYGHAEVTAGGVSLSEVSPAMMESRKCQGLYLVGEILDVDGRIGGYNFQWAWSTGFVAGRALAAAKS